MVQTDLTWLPSLQSWRNERPHHKNRDLAFRFFVALVKHVLRRNSNYRLQILLWKDFSRTMLYLIYTNTTMRCLRHWQHLFQRQEKEFVTGQTMKWKGWIGWSSQGIFLCCFLTWDVCSFSFYFSPANGFKGLSSAFPGKTLSEIADFYYMKYEHDSYPGEDMLLSPLPKQSDEHAMGWGSCSPYGGNLHSNIPTKIQTYVQKQIWNKYCK